MDVLAFGSRTSAQTNFIFLRSERWGESSWAGISARISARTSGISRLGNFLAWETSRKWGNPKIAPENARAGALPNRGAPESARGGAFPVDFLHWNRRHSQDPHQGHLHHFKGKGIQHQVDRDGQGCHHGQDHKAHQQLPIQKITKKLNKQELYIESKKIIKQIKDKRMFIKNAFDHQEDIADNMFNIAWVGHIFYAFKAFFSYSQKYLDIHQLHHMKIFLTLKNYRSEEAILRALGEFQGILGARNLEDDSWNAKFHSWNGSSRLEQHENHNSQSNSQSDSPNWWEPTWKIFICPCVLGAFFQELQPAKGGAWIGGAWNGQISGPEI